MMPFVPSLMNSGRRPNCATRTDACSGCIFLRHVRYANGTTSFASVIPKRSLTGAATNLARKRLPKFSRLFASHEIYSRLEARRGGAISGDLEHFVQSPGSDGRSRFNRHRTTQRSSPSRRNLYSIHAGDAGMPLIVTYRVIEGDRLVRILSVDELPLSEAPE